MPDPRTPIGTWGRDIIAWNQDRSNPIPDYETYPGINPMDTSQMSQIQRLLMALFSDRGYDKYTSELGLARKERKKDPVKAGTTAVKQKRDPLGDADRIAYGY